MEVKRESFRDILLAASLAIATFLIYLPAIHGIPLWDDDGHITRPDLQSLHGLWRIWFDLGATQQYYPLLHSAFWVEHQLWGDAVLGYHLVNIALHALSACLVVWIARRLSIPGAWIAGFLFALHPVCVESVAWISEQKSTLSAVFYLAAALSFLRFYESRRGGVYALASALFLLALLTKTVTATLPFALLVILWWRNGRVAWRRDVMPLAPWVILGAAAGLFTAWVERAYIGASGAQFDLTFLQRCLLACRAIWFYAAKLLLPVHLSFNYPRWRIDPAQLWQYLFPVALAAVAIALVRVSRRIRGPLAALLIFTGTLFPALGFFNVYPFRYAYVSDHFQYLASLAILIPMAAVLDRSRAARGLGAAVLLVLAALTWTQSGIYRDPGTLYRATLAENPESWLAHNNLANLLLQSPGTRGQAIEHLQAALLIEPRFSETHITLGNALLEDGRPLDEVIREYQTAAQLDPKSARAHNNLGHALLQAGHTQEAVVELQAALRIQPDYSEAHNNLGNALSVLGQRTGAVAEYQSAIRANVDFAEAHNNLGRALAQMPGRLPDAIAELETAVRIKPDYAGAHSNLGNALSMMPGRMADAVAEYQAALRINPQFEQAHVNLGNAFARMDGRRNDAIAEYQAALRLKPDDEGARRSLQALGR